MSLEKIGILFLPGKRGILWGYAELKSLFTVFSPAFCARSSVDRVSASEAEGRGFDPRRAHQNPVPIPD